MKLIRCLCLPLFSAIALTSLSVATFAQDKPALMVVASAHFGNPGRDNINIEVDDLSSDERQQQIEAVVQQLAEFRPTHIAIEISGRNQAELDKRYQDYREGRYQLNQSEADQLGFRLAALLGHERIHAVDWNGNPPGDIEADYNWVTYGQAHGQQAEVAALTDPESVKAFYVELADQSIGQWLRQLNSPAGLAAAHRMYLDIATIGTGDELIGANWVGTWYARNLKIYSRLKSLAAQPTDRVLVVYGLSHAYLLKQFAREHGTFNVIDVDTVLTD